MKKMPMSVAKSFDLGKALNAPLEQRIVWLKQASYQAANVQDRMHKHGVKNATLGNFEKSIASQNQKYGLKGLSSPKTGWKEEIRDANNNVVYSQSKSLSAIVNERLTTMINFLQGRSTVKQANEDLEKFREEHNWADATFEDVDKFWQMYDDNREAVKGSGSGDISPKLQETMVDWYQQDYDDEDREVIAKELGDQYLDKWTEEDQKLDPTHVAGEYKIPNSEIDPDLVTQKLINAWLNKHAKPSSEFRAIGEGSKV